MTTTTGEKNKAILKARHMGSAKVPSNEDDGSSD